MNPCTVFVNGENPFNPSKPPMAAHEIRRKIRRESKSFCQVFDAICSKPGVTTGELTKTTGNKGAYDLARLLVDAGEVYALMQRSSRHHPKAGVLHFYPVTGAPCGMH